MDRERERKIEVSEERGRESISTIGDQGSAIVPLLQRDGWW